MAKINLNSKNGINKYQLGLAGEYGVCSELLKRNLDVFVTLGNAKSVDIYVIKQGKALRIEVKTSQTGKFVTGFFKKYHDISNNNHPDFWILVYMDKSNNSHYYILTHQEMGDTQMRRNKWTSWKANPKGVDNILLSHIQQYENQWQKI